MFCFQCEQTANCSGCTGKAGVCGKSFSVADTQDELTGALIALARNVEANKDVFNLIIDGLFTTITNVSFNEKTERVLIDKVKSFGCDEFYDVKKIWEAQEDIRSLKSLILFGIRGMAAYAYHARALGYVDNEVNKFFVKALSALGEENFGMNELLPLVIETGNVNLKCMELLDKANTETFGTPVPTQVPLKIEKGPFIIVTGHDLHDLKLLLEQTEGKGVNIYTHGEMLPAHA
ncbi:MAG: hydroxylamine reductase, partial [Synergistaceae bacterium]|nr:hydroxylamine reductase [Synergistaceae bacterium]